MTAIVAGSYGRIRRFLPALLRTIQFEGTPAGESVLAAIKYLREVEQGATKTSDAPTAIVSRGWRRYVGLNAIVIPGTLRDSLYLLSVVLEQQTELHPTEIMTDTGAYTDVVFGLFWLLGYRFCPRIADIGGARYWRIDSSADYGVLNGVARHRINTKLIAEHWDDMLRLPVRSNSARCRRQRS